MASRWSGFHVSRPLLSRDGRVVVILTDGSLSGRTDATMLTRWEVGFCFLTDSGGRGDGGGGRGEGEGGMAGVVELRRGYSGDVASF